MLNLVSKFMYAVIYAKQLEKDFKRVDKAVVYEFKERHLVLIQQEPYACGYKLSGNLRVFWVYKFSFSGVHYRVAYRIYQKQIMILLVYFGTRENFYKELAKRK